MSEKSKLNIMNQHNPEINGRMDIVDIIKQQVK